MKKGTAEFRIYFECLEQARHFFLPKVATALAASGLQDVPVRLVRRPRSLGGMRSILGLIWFWTSPDILWTYAEGEQEWPLLLVEFSEAVKTEDHELQRSLPVLAGFLGGFFVVKISGEKESEREHGGNIQFNPLVVAKVLKQRFAYSGYFYAEWPTKDGRLQRDPTYLSCPPGDAFPVLDGIINALAHGVGTTEAADPADRLSAIFAAAQKTVRERVPAYRAFEDSVSQVAYDAQSLVGRVEEQAAEPGADTYPFRDRTLSIKGHRTYVKINRFDHAADPDRGVLAYLGLISREPTYAYYRIERGGKTQSKRELAVAYGNAKSAGQAFLAYGRAEGLQKWLLEAVESRLKHQKNELDITDQAVRNFEIWIRNKVSAILLLSADGLIVEWDKDNRRTIIRWNRSSFPIRGIQDSARYFTSERKGRLPLRAAQAPNEDEVTYVAVHDVLGKNGFKIASVSYPGHQGGFAILRSTEAGRTRSREYVDIVSIRSVEPRRGAPSLTESKDSLARGLQRDLEKILRYKRDGDAGVDLLRSLSENGFVSDHADCVLISVAFGTTPAAEVRWRPASVDFLVRLSGRSRWEVAPFGDNRSLFRQAAGVASLPPEVYEVDLTSSP